MPHEKFVPVNPCTACGACCAFFRASFFYREADDHNPHGVPVHLTDDLSDFRRVMRGTDHNEPYCVALAGEIGRAVGCSIYARRSSVCREFPASYHDGRTPNPDCDRARARHGLPPLRPEDWQPGRHDGDDHDRRPPQPVAA